MSALAFKPEILRIESVGSSISLALLAKECGWLTWYQCRLGGYEHASFIIKEPVYMCDAIGEPGGSG